MFRIANERMANWDETHAEEAAEPYFCECANPDCRERISLRRADYERIRSNSRYFFVIPRHETADVDSVIETHEDWLLIEKGPSVTGLIESLDPRLD